MKVVSQIDELHSAITAARQGGKSIGLVPTMGALHAGHLSLVKASRQECEFTVATIFVNPTQFAPHEDLAKYPRPLEADLQQLVECGVDLVFTPTTAVMYGNHYATSVDVGELAMRLEGAVRPDHFRGVATVVLKLFNLTQPDRAYFGQKDFQQTLVVKRMVADLNVPVAICVCPTVRDPDGLAMSSRNTYLSADERQQALAISRSLRTAQERVAAGERDANRLRDAMQVILKQAGIRQIDYIALADPESLGEVSAILKPTVAAIAVRVGATRLIDNELLKPQS